jgi:predicted AlkP superfamily pyrophosphatase or phosphodiesterase
MPTIHRCLGIWTFITIFCISSAFAKLPQKPKLVVMIVIDQFRADYLTRFQSRFLPAKNKEGRPGGFRYLMEQSAYYPFAKYDVLQCMTGPGHSMISTGAYPYQTGVPMNDWYDSNKRQPVYCVQDPDDSATVSPKNLIGSTIGDELKNAGHPSRVVSIALKDRAAIFMGGHRADFALWFDPVKLEWTSNKFYLSDGRLPGKLPDWISRINQEISGRKGELYLWQSKGKPTGLTMDVSPNVSGNVSGENHGFKHQVTIGTQEALKLPYGLELTTQAAEQAIRKLGLGKGRDSDLLMISFSSHDYLGHLYGPNTLEMEEMTLAEDRNLSKLFATINREVPGGLSETLIVLTGDHGVAPSSSWLNTVKINAGRLDVTEIVQKLEKRLKEKFGEPSSGKWVEYLADLNFYLSAESIRNSKASRETIEEEAKTELRSNSAAAFVFSQTDYFKRRLPPGMFERKILKTYFPGRSGDLVLIPKPYFMDDSNPVDHITGYSYDCTVPLLLSGKEFRKGIYSTQANVVDIAPTLAFILGIIPPTGAEGRVLSESLSKTQ